jgi:hypothetical protein
VRAFQVVVRESHQYSNMESSPILHVKSLGNLHWIVSNSVVGNEIDVSNVIAQASHAVSASLWEDSLLALVDLLPRVLGLDDQDIAEGMLYHYSNPSHVSNWFQLSSSLMHVEESLHNDCAHTYLCTHPQARVQLGLLVTTVIDDILRLVTGPPLGPRHPLYVALSVATDLANSEQCAKGSCTEIIQGVDSSSIMAGRYPYVDGAYQVSAQELSVGVLIFVTGAFEQAHAEARLAEWNTHCPLCNLCVSYMILPQRDASDFRSQLLSVSEWIESKSVNLDLVLVLSGAEAVSSFRYPGSTGALFPVISFEHAAYFQIPHNVVFAHKMLAASDPPPASCEDEIDLRAFTGFGFDIRDLIRKTMDDPAGKHSDTRLRQAFLKHVCTSDLISNAAAVDRKRRIFDFSVVSSMTTSRASGSSSDSEFLLLPGPASYLERMNIVFPPAGPLNISFQATPDMIRAMRHRSVEVIP